MVPINQAITKPKVKRQVINEETCFRATFLKVRMLHEPLSIRLPNRDKPGPVCALLNVHVLDVIGFRVLTFDHLEVGSIAAF